MTKSLNLAALLACGFTASAVAQHPAHPKSAVTTKQAATRGTESAEQVKGFTGIAGKLGTTPAALQQAYNAAKTANPKLTPGDFIAANVAAHNLGEKNAAITTQALLDGLKSGKTLGQAIHALGPSAKEAAQAEQAAQKEAKEAEQS